MSDTTTASTHGALNAPADGRVDQDKEGKYLTFALGSEEFGLEILKVREIIGYMEITAVPHAPLYVRGVINLRGRVIPVIDLRTKFGMSPREVTSQTCIIVLEIEGDDRHYQTGIIVDHVLEVLDIDAGDIEESPQFSGQIETGFILGMAKIGGAVTILLDIDRVVRDEGVEDLTRLEC